MMAAALAATTVVLLGLALHPAAPARTPRPHGELGPREPQAAQRARPGRHVGAVERVIGRSHRRRSPDPLVLAAWCDALARAVRGGVALRQAVLAVEPPTAAADAVGRIRHALDRGGSLSGALADAFGTGSPPPHLDLVVVVLRACALHGGPAAEPLDRCAAALRQRAALLGERRSQSAQARLSALVMTLLPLALLSVLLITSTPVRHSVTTPPGMIVIAAGGALNTTGWAWMRRLISGRGAWP